MNNEKHSKKEEIMNSLDGVKKMQAPDFFYTRLKARMQSLDAAERKRFVIENKRPLLLRPVFAFTVLVIVLVLNVISILKQSDTNGTSVATETENTQTIATAYNFDNNLSYELNQ